MNSFRIIRADTRTPRNRVPQPFNTKQTQRNHTNTNRIAPENIHHAHILPHHAPHNRSHLREYLPHQKPQRTLLRLLLREKQVILNRIRPQIVQVIEEVERRASTPMMRDIINIHHQRARDLHHSVNNRTPTDQRRTHLLTLLHIPRHRLDSQRRAQLPPGTKRLRVRAKQMIKLPTERIEERRPRLIIRDGRRLHSVLRAFGALGVPALRFDEAPELRHVRPARVILELGIAAEERIQRASELCAESGAEVGDRVAAAFLLLREPRELGVRRRAAVVVEEVGVVDEEGVHGRFSLRDERAEELPTLRGVDVAAGVPALAELETAEVLVWRLAGVAREGGECAEEGGEREIFSGLRSERRSTFGGLGGCASLGTLLL